LTQIDFYVKDLSTPASLRSDRGWPISIGTSGRFGAEQLAEFSGINTIEANPILCTNLREKFKNSAFNIEVLERALGEGDKFVRFYVSSDFPSVSSLYRSHVDLFNANLVSTEVYGYSIDSVAEEGKIKNIDLVKIDIEGGELNALKGALNSMSNGLIKRFIIEVHEDVISRRTIIKFLSKYGYQSRVVINTSGLVKPYIYSKYSKTIT